MLNLFVWLRSISFLRIFDSIRIFIFMFSKVILDLKGFLIVFVFFILTFGTCFAIIINDPSEDDGKKGFIENLLGDIML